MIYIKIIVIFLIIVISSILGNIKSKKYKYRVDELKQMQEALNIFKTKIKFTYEPIPEIFKEISKFGETNISNIFINASKHMNIKSATESWSMALEESETNMKTEDVNILKSLGNLLGKTDKEGQISEIELMQTFIETQISKAEEEKVKNEKLYKTLGTLAGVAISIILI